MYPKKGCLLPGSDADLTIWYPKGKLEPFSLTNTQLHHNVDYTPYEGTTFSNWPRYTILRGKVLWEEGKLKDVPKSGAFVKRGPSALFVNTEGRRKDIRRTAQWLGR